MKHVHIARAVKAAFAASVFFFAGKPALADVKDYEFQLVDPTAPVGPDATVAVRLVNKTTGKPVPDAVIFSTRLDMAPDGMADMATKIAPAPSTESGVYKFKANLSMAGRWQLSLVAKIQGEAGTAEGKLIIKAQP